MTDRSFCLATFFLASLFLASPWVIPPKLLAQTDSRPRVRDLGVQIGVLPTGPLNAITDVAGLAVGQTTLIRGENIRTGVTAILPHGGNLYKERVPGAIFLGNAYGKLAGSTQVNEMGEIETPILLTATDSVPRVADAVTSYMFDLKGNENVLSVNPVVGETNDGWLSDIRSRPITPADVFSAIKNATGGAVEEGAVGEQARLLLDGKEESGRRRGDFRHRWVATPWEFWSRQILVETWSWRGCRLETNSESFIQRLA